MIGIINGTIIRNLRKPKYLIFSALFPIFLTLLIGGLLGNMSMEGDFNLSSKTVYYLDNGSKDVNSILDIAKKNSSFENAKFTYEKVDNKDIGLDKVKKDNSIFLDLDNNDIKIYVASGDSKYYTYIKSMLDGISKSFATVDIMIKNNPKDTNQILENVKKDDRSNIEVKMMSKSQSPTGFDYYSIAELTMMVMYIMIIPLTGYFYDKKHKIIERIKLSGVSDFKYLFGSTIAYFMLSFLVTLPGFLFSIFVLNANWGSTPLLCYAVIQIFSLASIIIGTTLAFILDEYDKALNIIQGIILPVFSFLGGSYMALPYKAMGAFSFIVGISPLRWINKGIFMNIYEGKNEVLFTSAFIYLGISIVLILVLVKIFKGKESRI